MLLRSLTSRVLLIATAWAALALVVMALVMTELYRRGAERAFDELLRAQLFSMINSISVSEDRQLAGRPQFGDLRFSQPETGWYWIADTLETDAPSRISSISLGAETLPVMNIDQAPFDSRFQRLYLADDPFGNQVKVIETEVVLDFQNDGTVVRFRVAGNQAVVADEVAAFSRNAYFVFFLFGLGSLVINAGAILFGLRPLDRVRRTLEQIRNGDSDRLTGSFPREIAPLASEMNALLDSNRRLVERARMQVGNLAHSLKTPIAVLLNESAQMEDRHGALVRAQTETMQSQVKAYLDRAQIAAQRGSVLARTAVGPVFDRLLRVMRRLNPDLDIRADDIAPDLILAMEQQDLEEVVGNLVENAAKFAHSTIVLSLQDAAPNAKGDPMVALSIADDGPGLTEAEMGEAVKRGRRLDETLPGTGLGLSIVTEIAREYRGEFNLARSELGGLKATLRLPKVEDRDAQ